MRKIREITSNAGSSYVVETCGATRRVRVSCRCVNVNRADVYVFYDDDMKILYEPSFLLAEEMRWESDNTKLQAVSAMKLLYSFAGAIGMPPEEFDGPTCNAFLQFCRGTLGDGLSASFDLETTRSEATIGAYLKSARRLMKYLGRNDSPFLDRRLVRGPRAAEGYPAKDAFALHVKPAPDLEAPTAITISEYRTLLDVIGKRDGDPARPMVRLMFEHGLRIGEVLGLTLEDVTAGASPDGEPRYSLKLRDRVSDKPDQHAKTVLKVRNRKQYGSADYDKRNVGYQEVFISESAFDDLSAYIEAAHDDGPSEKRDADGVSGADDNSYVFLNTRGRPLSSNLWNKRLRSLFSEAGIPVDREARKTNLNHRFRHGYAMMLIHELKLDDFAVMTLMRHRSIASTEVYDKPTAEQVHAMQLSVLGPLESALSGEGGE